MKKQQSIVALTAVVALLGASVNAAQATLVENGSFEEGSSIPWETPGWWSGGAGSFEVDERGRFCTSVTTLGANDWGVQLRQSGRSFIEGETYNVRFNAWASAQSSVVIGAIDETQNPAVVVFDSPNPATDFITTDLAAETGQAISYEFTAAASTDSARIRFMMGAGLIPLGETLCLDDIVVEPPAKNIILNSTFEDAGSPWETPGWWAGGSGTSAVDEQGRMCTTVATEGTDDWGAQLRQTGKTLIAGRTYTVSVDAWSSADLSVSYDAIDEAAGYVILLQDSNMAITSRLDEPAQHIEASYDVTIDSDNANFRFLLGGGNVPAGETVCFDNVELLDAEGYSVYQPQEPVLPAVHVNQHGYAPLLSKVATYKLVADDATQARSWALLDINDAVVASGLTTVIGDGISADANSGDVIHQIDFSEFTAIGDAFYLQVAEGDEQISSLPFNISNDLMADLKYQALSYFYHNRSGIEILETVVGDAKWARPAGHLDDDAVETFVCKDTPDSEDCYSVNVVGGWYDAGDHGKYVVNGGISAWTLMNQYERAQYLGRNSDDLAKNTMALPVEETANELPDILDEAKWQVEWLLKMQVPAGKNYAGMAFHKMHDDGWTGLALAPHEDTQTRYIQAPTTAATLNLAAVGAQCARVFKKLDADLAQRCLVASEIALAAAKANPEMYSGKPADGDENPERFSMTNDNGGGMYGDEQVADEFFWAVAELYVTTRKNTYKKELLNSELYGVYEIADDENSAADTQPNLEDLVVPTSLFHWGNTNMLGAISIATLAQEQKLNKYIVYTQIDLLVNAADAFAAVANEPGYNMPMDSTLLEWGSNSGIVNNMIVLGVANDLSCAQDNRYLNAMANGMTYLLGNNPMGMSYVTGYGENAVQNPHHRFWSFQENSNYPVPPAGVMSGGPNSTHATTGDPVSLAKVDANCPAETCFVDDIGSWSTNEITINWNAPFAWATAYLDENMNQGLADEVSCSQRDDMLGSASGTMLLGLLLLIVTRRKKQFRA